MLPSFRSKVFLPSWVDDFFGKDLMSSFYESHSNASMPAVNIIEENENIRLEVAAPGLVKDDFKINIENNVLSVSSEKDENKQENGNKYLRKEFCYTCFRRSFSLPDSIDTSKINASHSNGILTIVLPKKEEMIDKGPRQISIN